MVFSKINPTINYPEAPGILPEDRSTTHEIFVLNLTPAGGEDVPIVATIGAPHDEFAKTSPRGVVYFPIYLVKPKRTITRIGVFEIPQSDYISHLDADGNINPESLYDPLLYYSATTSALRRATMDPAVLDITAAEAAANVPENAAPFTAPTAPPQVDADTRDKYARIPENRRDTFELTKGIPIPNLLPQESKATAKRISARYAPQTDHNWLQKYMKNPHYYIVNNEGGGDCFFAATRDAFSSIGQQTTVAKLRKKLAEHATQTVYETYRELYDAFSQESQTTAHNVKQTAAQYNAAKDRMGRTLDRNEKIQVFNQATDLHTQHADLLHEKRVNGALLEEVKFMRGVDSLEAFKRKVQTSDYWADGWAITTLERVLNIKYIILSKDAYTAGALRDIVQCGESGMAGGAGTAVAPAVARRPDFYIIVDYENQIHYTLVGYAKKQIFQFSELPHQLVRLVVDKCLERNAGAFAEIPDFARYNAQTEAAMQRGGAASATAMLEDMTEARLRNLYDPDVVFVLHHTAMCEALPGKCPGEQIAGGAAGGDGAAQLEFVALAKMPKWRRKLDDRWTLPSGKALFTLDNKTWASVTHFYEASKFKHGNPNFYLSYSMESGTQLSKDVRMAIAAASKSGKYRDELLRPAEVKIDPDFYGGDRRQLVLQAAQTAKFAPPNADLVAALRATKRAKLMRYVRKHAPELCEALMVVRERMSNIE